MHPIKAHPEHYMNAIRRVDADYGFQGQLVKLVQFIVDKKWIYNDRWESWVEKKPLKRDDPEDYSISLCTGQIEVRVNICDKQLCYVYADFKGSCNKYGDSLLRAKLPLQKDPIESLIETLDAFDGDKKFVQQIKDDPRPLRHKAIIFE